MSLRWFMYFKGSPCPISVPMCSMSIPPPHLIAQDIPESIAGQQQEVILGGPVQSRDLYGGGEGRQKRAEQPI